MLHKHHHNYTHILSPATTPPSTGVRLQGTQHLCCVDNSMRLQQRSCPGTRAVGLPLTRLLSPVVDIHCNMPFRCNIPIQTPAIFSKLKQHMSVKQWIQIKDGSDTYERRHTPKAAGHSAGTIQQRLLTHLLPHALPHAKMKKICAMYAEQ